MTDAGIQITVAWLQENSACSLGIKWFEQNHPTGGDYQAILDHLAAEGLDDWAE